MLFLSQEIINILKLEFDEKLANSILELACSRINKKKQELNKKDIEKILPILGEAVLLYGNNENLSSIFSEFQKLK